MKSSHFTLQSCNVKKDCQSEKHRNIAVGVELNISLFSIQCWVAVVNKQHIWKATTCKSYLRSRHNRKDHQIVKWLTQQMHIWINIQVHNEQTNKQTTKPNQIKGTKQNNTKRSKRTKQTKQTIIINTRQLIFAEHVCRKCSALNWIWQHKTSYCPYIALITRFKSTNKLNTTLQLYKLIAHVSP